MSVNGTNIVNDGEIEVGMSTYPKNRFRVERPYFDQEQLNIEFKYTKPYRSTKSVIQSKCKECNAKDVIFGIFPILGWLSTYNIKTDLIRDVVAGSTVAVMHISGGMGYAILANLPPICGIYTAFIPVLIYTIFGTSRHNSMGAIAVVSIMVGKAVLEHADPRYFNTLTPANNTGLDLEDIEPMGYTPIEVGAAVGFMTGMIQLAMYFLGLGVVSSLLSETLVSGFTTGAAIHVLTSQVKELLGITLTGSHHYFEIILIYIEVFQKIATSNYMTAIIAGVTIIIMVFNNDYLKPWVAKRTILPVPMELVLLITGTLLSRYLDLHGINGVKVIGDIPTGIPPFHPTPIDLLKEVALESLVIAIVSYTVAVSMALVLAEKVKGRINFNQELLAMGGGNLLGSLFYSFPFSASLARSSIQYAVGGRTQLASLVSCSLLIIVLLVIAPFFELLPRCVLGAIIVVSLKGLLLQTKQLPKIWHVSRLDGMVWISTFLAVVLISIDIGLLVGLLFSLASIFIRGMRAYTCLLGNIPNTDLYLDTSRYEKAVELPNIKIFHYCGSLNFASRFSFKSMLCAQIGIDTSQRNEKKSNSGISEDKQYNCEIKCLIIDFSALGYIDPSGIGALKQIINEFQKESIYVFFAGCPCPVYELMQKCELIEAEDKSFLFFPTVHDAVQYANDINVTLAIVRDN